MLRLKNQSEYFSKHLNEFLKYESNARQIFNHNSFNKIELLKEKIGIL